MHIDFTLIVILMLNVGLALAFSYYGTRLLDYQRVAGLAQTRSEHSIAGLQTALRVPRPARRYYVPRMRMKTDSTGDEPPHMPF